MNTPLSINQIESMVLILRTEIDILRETVKVLQEQVASLQMSAPRGIPKPRGRKR